MSDERAVTEVYRQVIHGWNEHSGEGFAAAFAEDGELIGFDGSYESGRTAIAASLDAIFSDHETAPYTVRVEDVRFVDADVALLRAAVGMIPPGGSDFEPSRNAWQVWLRSVATASGRWPSCKRLLPSSMGGRKRSSGLPRRFAPPSRPDELC